MKKTFVQSTVFAMMIAISAAAWSQDDPLEISPELQSIFAEGSPTSVSDLRAMQEHVVSLTKKVMPAVVGVRVGGASGSGVIISEDGYILTAGHVVQRPNIDCTIIMPDGTQYKGKTLGMQTSRDSGLMKITKKGSYPYLEMGTSKDLKRGQWIVAMGHPGGFDKKRSPPLRVGRIYSKPRTNGMIQTDCVLVGGDSGGPLFDMSGSVIGIHSRINPSTRDGQFVGNFHVPVDVYSETWDKLAASENIGRPSTGGSKRPVLGFKPDTDSIAPKILSMTKGGPFEKAGFKKGDVILEFDGKKVRTKEALRIVLLTKKKGDKVKVKVKRSDKNIDITVVIG